MREQLKTAFMYASSNVSLGMVENFFNRMDKPLNRQALATLHEENAKWAWNEAGENSTPLPDINFLESQRFLDLESCVQINLSWVRQDSDENDPLLNKSRGGRISTTGQVMDWMAQDLGLQDHTR